MRVERSHIENLNDVTSMTSMTVHGIYSQTYTISSSIQLSNNIRKKFSHKKRSAFFMRRLWLFPTEASEATQKKIKEYLRKCRLLYFMKEFQKLLTVPVIKT